MTQPTLPYPEPDGTTTAGWSGSDASRDAARAEAADGTATERFQRTLWWAERAGPRGITVADLRMTTGWHHGKASACLTGLHKAGKLARLADKRGRCHIYVTPEYIEDRVTEQPRTNRKGLAEDEAWLTFRAGWHLAMYPAEPDPDTIIRLVFDRWLENGTTDNIYAGDANV